MVLRKGDERLSGKDHGGDRNRDDAGAIGAGADRDTESRTKLPRKDIPRKDKASPVGRALRTVYDDMLRESVPDDFLDLLNKLD